MDGTKPSLNPAFEIYAGIGTAKAPLVVGAPRGGRKCQSSYDHRRAVLWPASRPGRAAFDRSNVAHS
jgi:hypothetical protein